MPRLTTLLAAGALVVLASREAVAQVAYSVSPPTIGTAPARTGWNPVTFTASAPSVPEDSGGATITPGSGFAFKFYDIDYTSFDVTADGLILFDNAANGMAPRCGDKHSDLCANTDPMRRIPDSMRPNNLIAFWWGDMIFANGTTNAQWALSGTAPNRIFSLKYMDWAGFDEDAIAPAPNFKSPRTVQVELYETTAEIRIYYGDISEQGDVPSDGASVGIEGQLSPTDVDGVIGLACTNVIAGWSTSRCRTSDWPTGKYVSITPIAAPDLTIVSVAPIAITSTTVAGVPRYTVDLSTTIANRGPVTAVGFKYDVYAASDGFWMDDPLGAKILAHATAETLANGERVFTDTGTTFAKPRQQNATHMRFIVVVDPTNAIVEASETNNIGVSAWILMAPDLQGEVHGPAKAGPNQPMSTRVVVRNVGADSTGPFTYELYLSSNELLDSTDTRLHSATLALDGISTSDNSAVAVNIPSTVVPGVYYLLLVMDPPSTGKPSGDVVEADETNNIEATTSTVQIIVCQALDVCHLPGVLDAVTGTCTDPVRADGAPCIDGDLCTRTDVCQGGVCTGSDPVTCTATDQCHTPGACDPSTGTCSDPVEPDGTACDDANACTSADSCMAGTCGGIASVICTAKDQCHVAGVCDPNTGACSEPTKDDGAGCDDGDACTQADVCQAGACVGVSRVTCRAMDTCHDEGVCDPLTGVCSTPEKADGAECPAGACAAGKCVAVTTPEPQPVKGAAAPETSGCGCSASGSAGAPMLGMALLALAGVRRRRGR